MLSTLFAAVTFFQLGCSGPRVVLTYGDSKTVQSVGGSNNQDIWQDRLVLVNKCRVSLNMNTGTYKPGSIADNGKTVLTRQDTVDADLAATLGTPDAILFNLGSNDAFFGITWPDYEINWKADLAYIWDAMHTKWPNARIYYTEAWRQGFDSESDTLAGWYATVAAGRDYVHLCDNERSWVKGADDGATMFWDGIHFSKAGIVEKARLAAACLGY